MDNNYFKRAGDLDNNHFKKAGNLSDSFFRRAGDIPSKTTTTESVQDYLLRVVSGEKYDSVCELGTLVGGGRIIVDFNRLQEMVNSGVNIVSANYINDSMIEIEFQEFRKSEDKGIKR